MTNGIRRRIMGVELASGLGKINLGEINLDEGKRVLSQVLELIKSGVIGYTLIAATRTWPDHETKEQETQ
jgi:hypothetical protein